MKRMIHLALLAPLLVLLSATNQSDYDIARNPDGPFSFSISGVTLNKGSSMERESILFNDRSCPVQLTAHSTSLTYKDRGFQLGGATKIKVNAPIRALQVRTILYDVFGQHMKNLQNNEPRDFGIGDANLDATWRAYDNDASELLTSVTYVARVRLDDGTQWIASLSDLQLALSTLHLEKKIVDDDGE